jgi:hypothetical protein
VEKTKDTLYKKKIKKKNKKSKETNHGGDNKASLVWNAFAVPQNPVSVAYKRRRLHVRSQRFLHSLTLSFVNCAWI